MKKETWFIWLGLILLLVMFGHAWGQQAIDARSAGMAYSNGAAAYGLEQVGLNPAMLALPYGYQFEFNLFSARLSFLNNALNKSQYDALFTTQQAWGEQEKQQLLQLIPGSGWQASLRGKVNTLAVSARYFSLAVLGMGGGSLTLPHQLFELALQGNQLGKNYQLDAVQGSGWAAAGALLSIGIPVHSDEIYPVTSIGATFKYLGGVAYFEILHSQANVFTGMEGITVGGEIEARASRGGSGYGLDLGVVTRKGARWQLGVTLINAIGQIRWQNQNEWRRYSVSGDSLSLPDRFSDSLLVKEDSTAALGAFTTALPQVLDVALAYRLGQKTVTTAELELPLNQSPLEKKRTRLAIGMETAFIPFLPLRTGFSVGGMSGFSWAVGTGINASYWILDVGYIMHGGIGGGKSRGATLAVTSRFRF